MKIMVLTAGTKALFWFRMDMMKSLIAQGHEVVAVGSEPEEDWAEEFAEKGITYRTMYVARTGTNPLQDLKTLANIRELIREERPDVLFAFHGKGNIYGSMAAHLEGVKRIYASVEGLGNVLGPAQEGKRDPKLVRAIMMTEFRVALRYANGVFFVNRENRDFFVEHGLCRPDQAIITDGIGVNLSRFTPAPLPQVPTFLFMGRLLKSKGVLDFAEAARLLHREHPEAKCLVIGPFGMGEDAITPEELQAFVDDGSVIYEGEQRDVRPYLARSSVFVLPSYYNEGLPKSSMEAMAAGRAIITTDTVGCRETVAEGENGLLVRPHDPDGLAQAMARLAADPALVAAMGAESRAIAERRFDSRIINRQIFTAMGLIEGDNENGSANAAGSAGADGSAGTTDAAAEDATVADAIETASATCAASSPENAEAPDGSSDSKGADAASATGADGKGNGPAETAAAAEVTGADGAAGAANSTSATDSTKVAVAPAGDNDNPGAPSAGVEL